MARRLPAARLAAAAVAALAGTGCTSTAVSSSPSPSTATVPTVTTASPGRLMSSAPVPAVTSWGGPVTVIIAGLPTRPVLAPGGAPLTFTVTLQNPGTRVFRGITPVVSMGHCACTGGPVALAPQGSLQQQDPATGRWHSVRYNPEGGGTDFLLVVQQPGITLAARSSVSFTFRVRFSRHQQRPLRGGATAIDVSVVQLPAHAPLGTVPTVSIPVQVLA